MHGLKNEVYLKLVVENSADCIRPSVTNK